MSEKPGRGARFAPTRGGQPRSYREAWLIALVGTLPIPLVWLILGAMVRWPHHWGWLPVQAAGLFVALGGGMSYGLRRRRHTRMAE